MDTLTHIYTASLENPATWPLVFGLTGIWLTSVAVVAAAAIFKAIQWLK